MIEKERRKKEQDLCTKLLKYFRYNPLNNNKFYGEAKVIYLDREKGLKLSGESFTKELDNLVRCEKHGLLYKFSDFGGMGTIFDMIAVPPAPGYFFIQYWKPRERKFYIIKALDIQHLVDEGIKTLLEPACEQLAVRIDKVI